MESCESKPRMKGAMLIALVIVAALVMTGFKAIFACVLMGIILLNPNKMKLEEGK